MILNRNSGDDLAASFMDLLNKNIKKTAAMHDQESEMYDHQESMAMDEENDLIESMLMDMEAAEQEDDAMDYMMEHDMEHGMMDYMMDSKAQELMSGLGKIAGSLRSKGEHFAADVVEATAISVNQDIIKEASNKRKILTELDGMVGRLSKKGNLKAAKEVIKTARKIAKS